MTIFNQTFSADKPIYYPSNWETGKTSDQLYQQWKQTNQFFIISNLLQILCASIWLFLLFVIFSSIRQLYRIYNLPDDNRQKMHNRKFIKPGFLTTTAFVSSFAAILTIFFCFDQFIRNAILKGSISIGIAFLSYWSYKNGKSKYDQLKRKSKNLNQNHKEMQQQSLNSQRST